MLPGFGHWWVLLILAAIALLIFGPQRLPELGAGLGKAIREFRKGASEMSDSLKEEAVKPAETRSETTEAANPPAQSTADAAAAATPPSEPPKA